MWSQHPDIAKDWAHGEHSSDKDHKMPEETGPGVHVKGKKVENAMPSLMERFLDLFSYGTPVINQSIVNNAANGQGRHPETQQFQGTHAAQATRSFAEAVGKPIAKSNDSAGVTSVGSQKTKDGRSIVEVDKESPDKIVEAGESDDHQLDDAPGRTGASDTSLSMSSMMKNMVETYNVACAILKADPEAAQVYNIDTELAYNRAWPQSCLDTLPESDFAGPSQTFPVENQQDLNHALHLLGKADNPEEVRNKLSAIAGRKGLTMPLNTFPSAPAPSTPSAPNPFTPPGQSPSLAPSIDAAHSATKQAAGASLQTEQPKAFGHAQGAMQASGQGDSDTAQGMHQKAASAHEKAATQAIAQGDQSSGDNNLQAAALHRKAAAMHAAVNNTDSSVNGGNMGRFFTTNMPAGGAFEGAKASGYPAAQAAAMAGKLEGSYEGGGADSSSSKEARGASAEAKRTGSARAHKAAASAHRDAADAHKEMGNTQEAAAHTKQAESHDRAAKKATNNAAIVQRGIAAGHINSAIRDQLLFALNTADESGSGSFDSAVQVGGEEDDDDATDDTPGQKVKIKGKGKEMSNNQLNALSQQMFGLPLSAVQGVLTNQAQQQSAAKQQLIINMTQHLDGQQRNLMIQNLRKFDLDDLQHMASLNPMMGGGMSFNQGQGYEEPLQAPFNPQPAHNFLGAGAVVPTVNGTTNNNADNDLLPLPTMNMDTGDGQSKKNAQ